MAFLFEFLEFVGLEGGEMEDVVVYRGNGRSSGGGGGGGGRVDREGGGDGFLELEVESEVEVGVDGLSGEEFAALFGGDGVEVGVRVHSRRRCCHWLLR